MTLSWKGSEMPEDKYESNYRIGAVSRLTGIPPDTLRVWERRYDLVTPKRSEGGGRLYSQEDVTRLNVIKRLVDGGHAIGTIAEVPMEQLRERLADTRLTDRSFAASRPVRMANLGATLPQRLQADLESEQGETIELVGSYESREEFSCAELARDVGVLVVELPVLDGISAPELRELSRHARASRTLVVFGFGGAETVAQLERAGAIALRFPVTWEEIRVLAGADRYPRKQQKTTETEGLEAGLIDVTTAKARRLMEQALQKAVEVEGIDLDAQPSQEV
jgi:DNA-binding transcriptional MerR regulator